METINYMYWRDLKTLLLSNTVPENVKIDLKDEKIAFADAAFFNRFGFRIPENLIEYEDSSIDFSDDADITDEDIETGKISWTINANFDLEPEIKQWIKKENIEINTLIPQLVKNFYETLKNINKNVVF
jgi:hypothetical protein